MPAGRPRKPTAIHILNGNPSNIKDLDARYEEEPRPKLFEPGALPDPPEWMTDCAKECWRECTGFLASQHLLSVADLQTLEQYCETYALWRKSVEAAGKRKETTLKSKKSGATKTLPQILNATSLGKQLLAIAREFGMTPAARGRMVSPGSKQAEDDMERLLKGG